MIPYAPDMTLGDVLDEDRDLSTFNNYIRRSGLIAKLDAGGSYTVFAPTNAAFDLLPAGTLGALTAHPDKLLGVLEHHIVRGEFNLAAIQEADLLPTLHGDPLGVVVADEGVVVGGAGLEEVDVPAVNGFLHKVSNVMFGE